MTQALRKSGITILGDIPWGTNICMFYDRRDDLSEIVTPFMLAGLENNEQCIWVTSEPLTDRDAEDCLRKACPDFEGYVKEGSIEIIPHSRWYVEGGVIDARRIMDAWLDKLDKALARGMSGMRITGNTAWVDQGSWKSFVGYEQEVDRIIGTYPMIALCSYSLGHCTGPGILDVIGSHQLAIAKREGSWDLIENSRGKQIIDALRESEDRYRCLVESSPDGLVVHRDGKILYANPVALMRSGAGSLEQLQTRTLFDLIPREERNVVGERIRQVMSGQTRLPLRETSIMALDGSTNPVETMSWPILFKGEPAVQSVIRDISEKKQAREQIEKKSAELEATFSAQNDSVIIFDTEMTVRHVNPSFTETYGFDPTGMSIHDIITRSGCRKLDGSTHRLEDLPTCRALHGEKVKGERFMVQGHDGTEMVIENSSGPMYSGGNIIGSVTDGMT